MRVPNTITLIFVTRKLYSLTDFIFPVLYYALEIANKVLYTYTIRCIPVKKNIKVALISVKVPDVFIAKLIIVC
jgi:hypothetical protein